MRRFAVVLAMLAATGAYVWIHPPVNLAVGRGALRSVPAVFGDWSGVELSFEDAVIEELQSDDLLVRRYERGGEVVWLCIVFHQNRRYGAHDPRVCYESQGYVVERPSRALVAGGSPQGLWVNSFVADAPRRRRLVRYWWTTAGLTTMDVTSFRRQLALRGALENSSWGALVRVETPIQDGDEAAATRRLDDFSARIAAVLPATLAAAAASATAAR